MQEFDLHRPKTVAEALDLLAEFGAEARVLAGGTDLMLALRARPGIKLKTIVDLSGLAELSFIREEGDLVKLGPLTTMARVAQSPLIASLAGLLAAAAAAVGSPQIRNRGTIGGNVANAAVCADTVPPLVALEAQVKLERRGGERWLSLPDFITGPNRTVLEPGELLTEIAFTRLPATASWGFMRLARRQAMAIARLNVAVVLDRDGEGVVTAARISPGAVLARPGRIAAAEEVLLGRRPDPALISRAAAQVGDALAAAGRRWSTPYKEPAITALTERAIKQALEVDWR